MAMVVTLETSPSILVSTSTVPSACDCPRLYCCQLSQRGRHVPFTTSKPSKQDTAGTTVDGVSLDSVVACSVPSVGGSIRRKKVRTMPSTIVQEILACKMFHLFIFRLVLVPLHEPNE